MKNSSPLYFKNMGNAIIITIILFLISFILLLFTGRTAIKLEDIRVNIEKEQKILESLNAKVNKKKYEQSLLDTEISTAQNRLYNLENITNQEQQKLETFKDNCRLAKESYFTLVDSQYDDKEKKINEAVETSKQELLKVKNLLEEQEQALQKKRDQIQALAIAEAREREKEENIKFYQIQISKSDIEDIKWLKQLEARSLKAKEAVKKLIWSIYYQKPTTEMCNRVVGARAVCGIYKITSLITHECYIGQSVNISQRFKNHAKCGLGIDAPSMNKLYKVMQEQGLHNFTFEVIEQCEEKDLNERERVWINTYASDKYGLNSKAGNK